MLSGIKIKDVKIAFYDNAMDANANNTNTSDKVIAKTFFIMFASICSYFYCIKLYYY